MNDLFPAITSCRSLNGVCVRAMLPELIKNELKCVAITVILILYAGLSAVAQKPELITKAGHRAMIRALALSPDNRLLASAGADKTIIIWDMVTEEQVLSLSGHNGWIFALAFSSDGKFLASGSYDGIVKIWNLRSKKIEFEISQPYSITSLVFSPDGSILVVATADKVINLWDMQTGKLKSTLEGHTATVTQVAFHPSLKALVSSSMDKTIRVWNITR